MDDIQRKYDIDELADFHARLSKCEIMDVTLSRRITALEERGRGTSVENDLMPMVWIMVLLTVAPIVIELVKQVRSQS